METRTVVMADGASLFVRAYGAPDGTHPPVLLLHGATADGETDWGTVAPLIGRSRHVLVPDCRGHGRSTNPGGGYSFRRLADDTAELIRALGFDRAHLVGHSNGGNVALVTLLEHPEVIASCVIQAGNAYVSDDLAALEPPKFDPERVATEAPGWRDEMIAIHGPVHGSEYWRTLLADTVAEIVRAPDYGPADLARVERATLIIEGANDTTNATAGHAAFMAEHIRDAELWRPAETGHGVHEERPLEWIARVEDFWERRGSDIADAVWRLRKGRDSRRTVFEVRIEQDRRPSVISGVVLTARDREMVREALARWTIRDETAVLEETGRPALIARPVANVLAQPDDGAERVTQALIGESVLGLDVAGTWTRVRLSRDGYLGWLPSGALVERDGAGAWSADADAWITSDVALVCEPHTGAVISRLPFGARLPISEQRAGWYGLRTPLDEIWWVRHEDAEPSPPTGRPWSIDQAIARFVRFAGVPYLWGGRTPYGFDCSGLSQAFWETMGTMLDRDADQQALLGIAVDGPPAPGDLLFFRQAGSTSDAIVHVAIALDGDRFLHASGSAAGTTVNSLAPGSTLFSARLADTLVATRRYTPAG